MCIWICRLLLDFEILYAVEIYPVWRKECFDGSVPKKHNTMANAVKLRLFRFKPAIFCVMSIMLAGKI